MTGFQNDVVITQIKELKPPEPQQQLIASSKTHRHLRTTPSVKPTSKGNSDPWYDTGKDPWAPYGTKPVTTSNHDGKQRLVELQAKLKQDLSTEMAVQAAAAAAAATMISASRHWRWGFKRSKARTLSSTRGFNKLAIGFNPRRTRCKPCSRPTRNPCVGFYLPDHHEDSEGRSFSRDERIVQPPALQIGSAA